MESNWELNHVGMVAEDLNKIIDYYQSLHIGLNVGPQPFFGGHRESEQKELHALKLYPKSNSDFRTATYLSPWERVGPFSDREFQIGSLQLELLPTSPGGGWMREYAESKGGGINHICFNVPDPEGETAKLVEKGCQLQFDARGDGHFGENWLDTRKFGDLMLSFRGLVGEWEQAWQVHNIELPMVSNWRFRGVGVAVRDLDETVEYYQYLGIGTFQPEVMLDSSSSEDFRAYGKTPDTIARARTRMAQLGPLVYEFVQPLEGKTVYKESLDSTGEGVNNIAFIVDDLEKETAKLVEKGAPVILSGKPQTGGAFAYFDTRKVGNLMVKLIQAE